MLDNYDVIVIFTFCGQIGATQSRVPDAWSVKLTLSSKVTSYITKNENRIKIFLT